MPWCGRACCSAPGSRSAPAKSALYAQLGSPVIELVPVWFAIGLVFAVFVGTGAGILGWQSGQKPAAAVLTGGKAFAGILTLIVLVISLLCCLH
jgi:hypothetical protein